jgi:Protein of unknown function (DUF3866)
MQRLAHPVEEREGWQLTLPCDGAVAVLALYDQLPALAWSFAAAAPGARLGYVQSAGLAAPGADLALVRELRARGLLAGHISVGAAQGGETQAITTAGALHHGFGELGWEVAVCGPGPESAPEVGGEVSSSGLAGLDAAHTALALGCPTLLVPRMSSGEHGERRRGVSHHTLTVLDLLLAPVTVALPAGLRSPVGAELHAGLGAVFGAPRRARPQLELDVERPARIARHDWRRAPIDLPAFAASGLPARSAGRGLAEDPLFFGAALAAGAVLGELALARRRPGDGEEDEHRQEDRGAAA